MHVHETTSLSAAKTNLAGALKNLTDLVAELESSKTRLAEAEKQQQAILASADPAEEDASLRKVGDIVQILRFRVAAGPGKIDSAKAELKTAADTAMRSFQESLLWTKEQRRGIHLDKLKAMVEPSQWPWCEEIALRFVLHTPDLKRLNELEARVDGLSRSVASQHGAEQLVAAITELEAEKEKGR